MTLFILCAMLVVAPLPASAITIPTVLVGDPGNPSRPGSGDTIGVVNYTYRIGMYEVTNAEYAAYLNAKANADPLGLYNTKMGSDPRGGISQSGVSGSFTYETRPNMDNKPVNFVSWYDSIRFVNWLQNGQGGGDTETGAYTILGGTKIPSNELNIARSPTATWFLPNNSEWVKAAYYQPANQGGDADNYWTYPVRSNTEPYTALADSAGNLIIFPGRKVVNGRKSADWNGQDGNVTTVGSAGLLNSSYYGTYDQGGNVAEWIEDLFPLFGIDRGVRGGSWSDIVNGPMMVTMTYTYKALNEDSLHGFRVATITGVPEPSTLVLAAFGALALLIAARRRR